MSSSRHMRSIGSGTVVVLGIVGAAVALLALGRVVGWDPTWRTFGVTPLQPPFFDMHVINDYAACAGKGVDAYAPHACNVVNFNIPPTWLWLGFIGIDGSDSSWLSAAVIAAATIAHCPGPRERASSAFASIAGHEARSLNFLCRAPSGTSCKARSAA